MSAWTSDELDRLGKAEELHISSLKSDGTLRTPVIVWVVRVGDDLYVRSVGGRGGAWFLGALARHEGHIRAGGVEKDVAFVEEPGPDTNDRIDEVYRSKYRRYAANIVGSIVRPAARDATIKLVPNLIQSRSG